MVNVFSRYYELIALQCVALIEMHNRDDLMHGKRMANKMMRCLPHIDNRFNGILGKDQVPSIRHMNKYAHKHTHTHRVVCLHFMQLQVNGRKQAGKR